MNESWEVGERLGPKRMHFCSCVSHWNAVLVCLISQYSICSNAHFRLTAAAQSRLGQQPSHCKRPTPRISGGVCRYRHYGKDTQAVVHVLERLFVGTETCLDQLVDEVHLQTVHQSSAICQYTEGRGGRMDQGNEMSIHIKKRTFKAKKVPVLPPVSLSSTRMSNFSSLQGISGSSPITVKVASNSPSTRNFTRPLAVQFQKNIINSLHKKEICSRWKHMWRKRCLPTVKFASWGGKSVVTRRCRKIWLSCLKVVCFSALVMGSGGIILSCEKWHKTFPKNPKQDNSLEGNWMLTLIQVGKRGYDPVVSTSIAKGMAKLGRRAWTKASLARDASLSAVSTNKMVCWSKKLEIIFSRNRKKKTKVLVSL